MATEKNITMKQFNGTDYDTLYPKTIASQIPDVYSKSQTYPQSQLYTRSQLYTQSQIDSMINTINTALDGKARIQTGSYVGTGTYGKDNPCSLTFDFVPKYLAITTGGTITNNFESTQLLDVSSGSTVEVFSKKTGVSHGGTYYYRHLYLRKSSDGKIISWYSTCTLNGSEVNDVDDDIPANRCYSLQNNYPNSKYYYYAFA